jgi:hypothetical protein
MYRLYDVQSGQFREGRGHPRRIAGGEQGHDHVGLDHVFGLKSIYDKD